MYRSILIPLTGWDADKAVIEHVGKLAAGTGAKVTLLQVIRIAEDGGGGFARQIQLEAGSSGWHRKRRAETLLPQLAGRLWHEEVQVETAVVIGTRPEAEEIVRYAAEGGCDLIAMAYDDRPWYRRWIGGSPIAGVLRRATVPTLSIGNGVRQAPAVHQAPEVHPMMALLGSPTL
jgi:nucleotide-binding universal stress UspA family protein